MKRRIFLTSLIFVILLGIALFCNQGVKAATPYNSEISYEEKYDGTIAVEAAGEYIESATIPSYINGKPVTEISYDGFSNCKYLKTVTLPSTISIIDSYAFSGCTSLTSINIPDKVTTIEYMTFYNCSSLKNISLKNVTKIDVSAFEGCSSLSSVTFSSNLNSIGDAAFKDSKALKTISFPSKLNYLGDMSFYGSGLTSVTIPSCVKEMPYNYGAFENCKSLKTATINASVETIPDNLFKGCTALTTVTFSSSSPVTYFEDSIFEDCTSLTSVTLPPRLTNLSRNCFKNCTSLSNITIPDSVTTIEYWAFENCKNLTNIKIPCGVKEIEEYVFQGCTSLRNIYFTKSIQKIGEDAFYNLPASQVTFYGYDGTAAKYYAQEKGHKFITCTPVTGIKISGATKVLKGSSITLNKTITPTNAFNKDVKWISSNSNIAKVDSNGKVTGVKAGTATITATAKDGTLVKGTYQVTVILTELPFKDITVDHWGYSAVKYCYQNGIIKGLSNTTFSPNTNLTRGMLVTILNRMEGSPKAKGASKFADVKDSSKYYYNSVAWATENKIVSGYDNGKFGPNDSITREQLAIMLNKYCRYKGKYKEVNGDLSKFKDANKIASYAVSQMKWAVGVGVITGNSTTSTLNPKGNATRAEVASMLYKYCTRVK